MLEPGDDGESSIQRTRDMFGSSSGSFETSSNVVDLSSTLNRSLQPKYRLPDSSVARSSRTPMTSNTSRTFQSYNVIALVEGKSASKGTIGLACMDLRFPDVELCEFIDSASYTRLKAKIQVEDPVEVILADSINDKSATLLLMEVIKSTFPHVTITTIHKRYFNEKRGCELVQQLAHMELTNVDANVQEQKRYCMASCAALVKYIEHIQNVMFSAGSIRFTFCDIEKTCMIDIGSWKNLEIIDCGTTARGERRSLLSIVDNTLTANGARLLRSNLLQPSADNVLIDQRLDAVEELLDDAHLLDRLREVLARIYDLDHVLTVCVRPNNMEQHVRTCENNIMQLLRLKRTLDIIEPLRRALQGVKSNLLTGTQKNFADDRVDKIITLLEESLNSDVLLTKKKNSITVRNQKCYAIKEGLSVNLDVSRKAYEELWKDLQKQQDSELKEHLEHRNTRMAYSAARGFHYVWVCADASIAKLPSVFINEVRNRSSITFTSRKLIKYNDRIEQSIAEVMLASGCVADTIIEQIRGLVPVLYFLMDSVALLDFLCSLAIYASNTNTTRPKFGSSLLLKNGRHPLLDHSIPDTVVANDTYLTPESRFALVTGPNMAGKSTYLKQVCQLSILAQTGSMITADLAIIPVFRRIFSRVGHNDSLTQSLSAFALEMKEMAVILQYSDNGTLVVIDELARSTSTEEGIGISYAIAEDLLKKEAFAILATHFLDLSMLDVNYPTVENFHFSPQTRIDEDGNEVLDASHKLYKGPYNGPLYGFELVQLSTFPESVTERAREMATRLRAEGEDQRAMSSEIAMRRVMVRTAHRLRQAIAMGRTAPPDAVKKFLKDTRRSLLAGVAEAELLGQSQDASQRNENNEQEDMNVE